MATAFSLAPLTPPAVSEGKAFLDSLPVYRFAMLFAAASMADLNFPGSPRAKAMSWWVSNDEGLAQVSQVAELIARLHQELLRLPPMDAESSPAGLRVLSDKNGQRISLSDLASKEEVLDLMRNAAGITREGGAQHTLSDTPEARHARGLSATLMREACDRVCVHIRRRFAPTDMTPKRAEGYQPPPARSSTPTL